MPPSGSNFVGPVSGVQVEGAAEEPSVPLAREQATAAEPSAPADMQTLTKEWLDTFSLHLEALERSQTEYTGENGTPAVDERRMCLAQTLQNHQRLREAMLSIFPAAANERIDAARLEAIAAGSQSSCAQESISRGFSLSDSTPAQSNGHKEGALRRNSPAPSSNGSRNSGSISINGGSSKNGSLAAGGNGCCSNGDSNNDGSSNNGSLAAGDAEGSDESEAPSGSASGGRELPPAPRERASRPHRAATTAMAMRATTLTVYGIPGTLTQDALIKGWELEGSFDFFHLRRSISTLDGEMLAIVNFLSPAGAARFRDRWHGGRLSRQHARGALAVSCWSVQGKDANLMLIRDDAPVLPVVVLEGERLGPERVLELICLAKKGLFVRRV